MQEGSRWGWTGGTTATGASAAPPQPLMIPALGACSSRTPRPAACRHALLSALFHSWLLSLCCRGYGMSSVQVMAAWKVLRRAHDACLLLVPHALQGHSKVLHTTVLSLAIKTQ